MHGALPERCGITSNAASSLHSYVGGLVAKVGGVAVHVATQAATSLPMFSCPTALTFSAIFVFVFLRALFMSSAVGSHRVALLVARGRSESSIDDRAQLTAEWYCY